MEEGCYYAPIIPSTDRDSTNIIYWIRLFWLSYVKMCTFASTIYYIREIFSVVVNLIIVINTNNSINFIFYDVFVTWNPDWYRSFEIIYHPSNKSIAIIPNVIPTITCLINYVDRTITTVFEEYNYRNKSTIKYIILITIITYFRILMYILYGVNSRLIVEWKICLKGSILVVSLA